MILKVTDALNNDKAIKSMKIFNFTQVESIEYANQMNRVNYLLVRHLADDNMVNEFKNQKTEERHFGHYWHTIGVIDTFIEHEAEFDG